MEQVFKVFFLFIALVFVGSMALAQEKKSAEEGRKIFVEKRCYTCHTVKAEGELIEKEKEAFAKSKGVELKGEDEDDGDGEDEDKKDSKIGGDLSHVGKEREGKWIRDFIQKPKDQFKDSSDCKRKAKKKDRKRFKGTEKELEVLVGYISGLKYPQQEKKPETCLKE
ncbi:MAG TPA: c-type cytochrome [Nitrospiria bacterium]